MFCGVKIWKRKKGKRLLQQQQSAKSSRSASPVPSGEASPCDGDYQPLMRTPPPSRAGPPPSPPVPTRPVAPVAPEPSGPLPLVPCQVCGRTFLPQSLTKHAKICEKMTVKKRKTFDSSRQRREGTDLAQYLPKNFGLPENSPFLEKSPPPTAKPAPKPKVQSVRNAITKPTAELQKCPHCLRAFGVRAFERHVEWCADKAKLLPAAPAPPPPRLADAKQRLHARTQYKAPLARGRKSSVSRDKSSHSRSASVDSSRDISPPREFGDYRHARTRASESASSNDCHEDSSPHVPVIRNSRNQTTPAGDANVKARQARLARDISNTRLDDNNYDPFASAARQMKELMSSDTNISKKLSNSSKDLNRTLPILRNTKEKSLTLSYTNNNTKIMKDTLNKSYQKTPTLQRMKSFGSTNNDNNTSFGGRCSSFRINRNDKKSSQKLNTTFTKSSKENISTMDKSYFNRNSNLNRSFSNYNTTSNTAYSTPKPRDKIPKIATSMYHSFQRTTIKQPVKLDKIQRDVEKKNFVNLDSILGDDNSSIMTDSSYIDPRLINENDNLPINVNTILNNPDIISSMESLLTTENLPAKFESFSSSNLNNNIKNRNGITNSNHKIDKHENNNNVNKLTAPIIDDLSTQYEKIMSSLEQSVASKTSVRDDESLCEDFDLEEFMTTFDDEIIKHKLENKRTCSSTTRIVKQSELVDSNKTSECNSVSSTPKIANGMIPVNKSMSLTFSSSNIANESLFPSSVKRSTSLLDSIQKKSVQKERPRHKPDQLEQDLMQSLKDFDKMYASEKIETSPNKGTIKYKTLEQNGTTKRDTRSRLDRRVKKDNVGNGNYTPNGKSSNDSAYSSLNRISPSKLSVCTKESNGLPVDPPRSDSRLKEESRSVSSEEFLAMERSTELEHSPQSDIHSPFKDKDNLVVNEKRANSRSSWRQGSLSSSGSEVSLARAPPRLSRFCHECGTKFSVASAKFCIECGVRRLLL